MKNTIINMVKQISKKFVSLLLTALATAIGEWVIGGVYKGFNKIKRAQKIKQSTSQVDPEVEANTEDVKPEKETENVTLEEETETKEN